MACVAGEVRSGTYPADGPEVIPFRNVTSLRAGVGLALALTAATVLAGCATLDKATGDPDMTWEGGADLPAAVLPVFRARPAVSDLTAAVTASAFGLRPSVGGTPSQVKGPDWTITVTRGVTGTGFRFVHECGDTLADPGAVTTVARDALKGLGDDPDRYSWFTVVDAEKRVRAVAEPLVDGHPSWSTGIFSVLVDHRGVCSGFGNLMYFEPTGESETLPSAEEAFHEARNEPGRVIAGRYTHVEPTWTLASGGAVIPAWRFTGEEVGIVMVDLGDGWETTLDTRSYLESLARTAAAR